MVSLPFPLFDPFKDLVVQNYCFLMSASDKVTHLALFFKGVVS